MSVDHQLPYARIIAVLAQHMTAVEQASAAEELRMLDGTGPVKRLYGSVADGLETYAAEREAEQRGPATS